ncbi:LemA family protein [Fructobacillus tropaeoli]|uniref:Lipoprotein antigen LemA family (LemA) n=1 Tax=Fructobacillus tropaeoli TaxID=709323 RepID=A0ABN9YRD2_9LACO|nr:LemA family protein [Fructobacillus tropaeoli]NLS38344.1 LemA family protein [Fructobacillus tropaeoli]CAK1240253.1 Magnetosome formation protein MamQ [Fructobacillus tropaeoli]CAK1240957.1 Magnetosome formation protein MamQ [Fructobacillus tropaeoli]CAK1246242.1 Magnetosome formation protein MamQ [Fructobacillus tropaeoli]CAK1251529.1 Magnetosome formation protein MamQ [Fructobacillus tropaeoli]
MTIINEKTPFYKKRGWQITAVVALVFIILIGGFISSANGLSRKEQDVDAATGGIQTALQNRADLIPNLVNAVKGAQGQESAIYGKIADARTQYNQAKQSYANANDQDQKTTAMQNQDKAFNLMVSTINENYPDLKSSDQIQTLMVQLEGVNNRVTYERKVYNKAVQDYNNKVVSFPSSLVASMTNHHKFNYFTADSSAQQNPTVNFSK